MAEDPYKVIVTGVDEVKAGLSSVATKLQLAAVANVTEMALEVEAAAKLNFAGSHGKDEPHVTAGSTDFGPMPNVVTGNLRRSVQAEKPEQSGVFEWSTRVGPTAAYGRAVELGQHGHSGFPYFTPAVDSVRAKAFDIVTANLAAIIK